MRRREPHPDLRDLLESERRRLDEVATELVVMIRDSIEMYRDEAAVPTALLRRSARSNLEGILNFLEFGQEADISAARRTGQERAAQDIALPEVLRAFRLGFVCFWNWMLTAARERDERAVTALTDMVSELWVLSDEFSTAVTESYRREKTKQAVALDRRRSALVAGLIDGTLGDHQTPWEIAQLLDMPFEGAFLVVVAETPPTDGHALPHLEDHLSLRDIRSAWRSQPDREIGIVHRNRRHTTEGLLELISTTATSRVGVSPEYTCLDRTSRGARFASIALETMPAGSTGMKQLPDTPLGELVLSHPDTTRRFVRRVLGEILALPDEDRSTLLSTAQAWIGAHGSAAEAGRILYCHENTVRYRMRRVEERLGIALDDPIKHAEFAAALEAIQVFPDLSTVRLEPDQRI
ncbi:PucR family transcriptional regulator [Nocardia jiangxiensis]|uniref:PucR family transcriptional regulator n=1 Tax=Nocardia jiangxiensis TaxID=282685 RepID=A0ABW6SDV6_9NOCA|nr:helix-turn-helix domain-containing protein [Nocardia jiangxiensis]